MDQGNARTSIQRYRKRSASSRRRNVVGASLLCAVILGGCAVVSGVDEFSVADTDTSSSSSGGTAGFVSIGGSVSGLLGAGLVLRNNGSDDIQIGMNGPFAFPAKVQEGSVYNVTVASFPSSPSQSCIVQNGSGTAAGSAITDIVIECSTATYSIGGTVVGLTGNGLVLTNSGADDLSVAMNGAFTFSKTVSSGAPFDVAVKTQPSSGGPCVVSGGSGVVGNADVSSVIVNCAPGTYTVGGTISGLVGTVILQQNGGADLTLTADGTFAFAQTLAPGAPYSVTVSMQPSYPPRAQECVVTNGAGMMGNANITNVAISCTTKAFTIGGNATGLSGPVVLKNGTEQITVNASGAFTFTTPVQSGNTYAVSVVTPPSGQTCTVNGGSGTVANGNVTNVSVACSSATGNQGILCGGQYCALGVQECCWAAGAFSCVDKCTGGGTGTIKCDSAADCQDNLVCCGVLTETTVNSIYCAQASLCTAPKAYFCDPAAATPCPDGGTCTATTNPPGYYRCF